MERVSVIAPVPLSTPVVDRIRRLRVNVRNRVPIGK
jgi:hypothetical protein